MIEPLIYDVFKDNSTILSALVCLTSLGMVDPEPLPFVPAMLIWAPAADQIYRLGFPRKSLLLLNG